MILDIEVRNYGVEGIKFELFIIGNGFDLGHELPTQYWGISLLFRRL